MEGREPWITFLLFWRRLMHIRGRAEWLLRLHTQLRAAVGKWGMNSALTLLWEEAILSMTQICNVFMLTYFSKFLLYSLLSISQILFLPPASHISGFFFPCRSGINSLWSVWKYWLVTQARCCVCNMTKGSLSLGLLTQPSGMTHILLEEQHTVIL